MLAAYGDVMMYSRHIRGMQAQGVGSPEGIPDAKPLTIRYVQVSDGFVTGNLVPYRDPDCECLLDTIFKGEMIGDSIEATFTAYGHRIGLVQHGKSFVKRSE